MGSDIELADLFDDRKSLAEGRAEHPRLPDGRLEHRLYSESGFVDAGKPTRANSERKLWDFLHHEPVRMKIAGINMPISAKPNRGFG